MRFLWFPSVEHRPRTKPSPFQRWAGLSQLFISLKGSQGTGAIICIRESRHPPVTHPKGRLGHLIFHPPCLASEGKALYRRPHEGTSLQPHHQFAPQPRHTILSENLFPCFMIVERFPGFPSVNGKQLVIALPRTLFLFIFGLSEEAISALLILFFVENNCDKV